MSDKPQLEVIYGERAKFERSILNLIISPNLADNKAEFDRLLAILKHRGDLSLVQSRLDNPPASNKIKFRE